MTSSDWKGEDISKRISGKLGVPDLTDILAEKLSGSDLHSLLLAVLKRRVRKFEPLDLMQASSLTKACDLDGRLLKKLECVCYSAAPEYAAIELSPLCPLGTVAVLSGLDQGNVLSTVRAFECASDPTAGMALECARRRKNKADRKVVSRLCTNQRVVRFPLPQNPAYTAHFNMFSLATAGRDAGSFSFETTALREHIQCYLTLMSNLVAYDFAFEEIVVQLSDTRVISHLCSVFEIDRDEIRLVVRARDSSSSEKIIEQYTNSWPVNTAKPAEDLAQYNLAKHLRIQLVLLQEKIFTPLSAQYPRVRFEFNTRRLTGLGYYRGPCFHIKAKNDRGEMFMLADGGFVDWTQGLLSDGKERLMTSAIGTELICRMFLRSIPDRKLPADFDN